MIKKIIRTLRKTIIAGFMLYAYNVIAAPLNLFIPINVYTILITTIFGVIAIPFLLLLVLIIF